MTFVTDKEKLKSGLIIFRRGDVAADSVKNVANRCRRVLDAYLGSMQNHLIS